MKVFELLGMEFEERRIPARLTEEGSVLSVFLSEELAGREVFGDIYFVPSSAEEGQGGYWCLRWEVAELSELPDTEKALLMQRIATINPFLTTGGYGYFAGDESKEQHLVFKMTIPVAKEEDDDWLKEEITTAAAISASIIKDTSGMVIG